jgi:MFS family permease
MYSIAMNFFPDNKRAMVGYLEASAGIGLVIGPPIGSILYTLSGY